MSTNPNDLISYLKNATAAAVALGEAVLIAPQQLTALLNIIEHQDAQLTSLRVMAASAKPSSPLATAPAESICVEADRLVSFDRAMQYGHPKEDMNRTAAMWEPIFGLPPGAIGPDKVAMAMICVKLSRLCHGFKRDSAVDIAGYAKCIDLIHQAS
jgi:hypothetical protein